MPTRLPPVSPTRRRELYSSAGLLFVGLLSAAAPPARAQGPNYLLPPPEIERRLAAQPFEVAAIVDNRWAGDRTQRAALRFGDGLVLPVKWARSEEGGFALNNQPRYELAAYRLQRLFLDPDDHVVPPTVLRAIPLRVYRQLEPEMRPTFEGTRSVLVVLQYWLEDVDVLIAPDSSRFDDDVYARRLGNLNLLTYLIRHADSNHGNVLVSRVGEPRMFTIDNGVAFGSPDSPRGTLWKDLHLDRVPDAAVARLRRLDRATLALTLGTLARLRVDERGRLEAIDTAPRRSPHRGVEFDDGIIQLGLTEREIDGLWTRLQQLIARVDRGEITTF